MARTMRRSWIRQDTRAWPWCIAILALSPHFHLIALDGVFVEDATHGLRFIEAGEPSKLDVAEVVSA